MNKRLTWDQALRRRLSGDNRYGAGSVLTAFVVLGLILGSSPGISHAEYSPPGLNDAQIDLSNDGYEAPYKFAQGASKVTGRGFQAAGVAEIFQCAENAGDLHAECMLLGSAPTDFLGNFGATQIVFAGGFVNSSGRTVTCSSLGAGARQCAIVAATFGPDLKPTARADHLMCFENVAGCKPKPPSGDPTPVPLNSANGERLLLSKDRAYDLYVQVVDVSGSAFVPSATAEIFKCKALAYNLRDECTRIGSAPTDNGGKFGPVPVAVDNLLPNCAGYGPIQCSVVAATFASPTATEPTSRAEHFVCVASQSYPCTAGDPTIPTTTTLPPEWLPAASMSDARQRHAAATGSDGRIYSMGGHEADGTVLSSAEVFDSCGTRTWKALPPMPKPRTQFAAAGGPDGRIYAIGGTDELSGTPLASVDAYDPTTNTWLPVASLAVPRARLAATTGPDGRIYAIGGVVGSQAVSTVEAYDPETNAWQVVAPLNVPRSDLGAATAPDGRIFVIGGNGYIDPFLSPPVEYYASGSENTPGVWQARTAKRLVPRDAAVTAGPDGLLYVIGGQGVALNARRAVMAYDPVNDGWADLAEAMTTHRTTAAAVAAKDGRVYAIGGSEDPEAVEGPPPLASTESLQIGPNNCPALPPVADFNGDLSSDIAVFRPANGVSFFRNQTPEAVAWGAEGDIPVPGDYDGDKQSELAVFRPSNGVWYLRGQAPEAVGWGTDGDIPVPADYDGDHKTDVAVFRPSSGTWYIRQSATGAELAANYGIAGDIPVPADYDGDRKADIAVFRPSSGMWYLQGQSPDAVNYGAPDDVPVAADYDGDGDADIAVFRPSNGVWYLRNQAPDAIAHGTGGDIPVPGDYDGDGIADIAVFRPSNGVWYLENGQAVAWGTAGDIPLPLPPALRTVYFSGAP